MKKQEKMCFSIAALSAAIFVHKQTKKIQNMACCKGRHVPYGPYEALFKRPLDVVSGGMVLVILSPVVLATWVIVRVKLGKPVLFKQKRTGLNGKPFLLYKFRTMTDKRDQEGRLLSDEDRLTMFGRKLRSTSLDELPSIINVVKGELSLIGPRPLPVEYLDFYTDEEAHRHDIRPGITGLAQVNGRNYVSWSDKFSMDCDYVEHVSFVKDILILFKTIKVIIKHDDIETASSFEHEGVVYQPLNVERKK